MKKYIEKKLNEEEKEKGKKKIVSKVYTYRFKK